MASQVLHGVSNLSGLLLENAGMIPVFLAVFFIALSVMIPVQIKFGAESARVLMAGICFFFAGVVLFVQKIAGEATLDQIAELLGTITGNVSWTGGNFCGKHRSCADFVWDQCKIYGETGDLEKFKDAGFHVCM